MRRRIGIILILLACSSSAVAAEMLLVEAEAFERPGGWVNDSQFMDQMGSPFLLAHGLGRPVDDAKTTVKVRTAGSYRIWVRTRDWVAQWTKGKVEAPGRFKVVIDGTPLEKIFGTAGEMWHWQDGCVVVLKKGRISLALHDLTGFEGRCDAILLCSDVGHVPPDDAPPSWRRALLGIPEEPVLKGDYDLVVVGGGIAGLTASISAARLGLAVALIHNRPVTGGASSPESGVGLAGGYCLDPYPHLGLMTHEISWSYGKKQRSFDNPEDAAAYQLKALRESGVKLFVNFHANDVVMEHGRIRGVIAANIVDSSRIRANGKWFADATGDGCIGFLAGADYDISGVHMGRTNLWSVRDTGKPVAFPRCPWAIDLSKHPFPGRTGNYESALPFKGLFGWYWESGFDQDPFEKGEHIRDNNFRAMYGAWDCLKNVDRVYPNHEIERARHISGKRESRRLIGDLVLTRQDIRSGKVYEDGCVPLTWRIDVHIPNPWFTDRSAPSEGFTEAPFIAWAQPGEHSHYRTPYWMPYRCLYSRNVPNLFMAGRDISVTHEALGAVRVQATTGTMGEIVGMAASLCKKHKTDPRGVYKDHLAELKVLMDEGTGKRLPVRMLAYEPFDFAGRLDGNGSGTGWKRDWTAAAGTGPEVTDGCLRESKGGVASQRFLDEAVSLAGGRLFLTFLAQKDAEGAFKIYFSNGRHIRCGLEVKADGSVVPQGGTAKESSRIGLFEPDVQYLVVLRFVNTGGPKGAVASVALFKSNESKIPTSQRQVEWDVVTPGAATGVEQDRIVLAVLNGKVRLDELRMGATWESVITRAH